jgi:LacI family transcriptional regulator
MTEPLDPLADLLDAQRAQAYTRYRIIRPALEDGVTQSEVARANDIPASTVQRWVTWYREKGIAGLADSGRSDKGTSRRLSPDAIKLVEKLTLQSPRRPVAEIHRQVTEIAQEQGWNPPSYARVRQIFYDTHINNIASLAGVSTAMVSRVLNQKSDVDPATRERILRIMDEQGFQPNIAASGLAGKRSRLLGALVPSLTWPKVPELMRGASEVVEFSSHELILYSINEVNHEKDHSDVIDRIIGTRLVAGLLAVFPGPSARHLAELQARNFPVILIDDQWIPPEGIHWISVDNREGAYQATQHLIRLGHRRIAHIQGPLKYQVSHDRFQGYCDALNEAGIPLDPTLVREGDFLPLSGHTCANAFFALPAGQRPTAIFAGSDYMAYGAISAASQRGLRVPEDIAVVGFDDNPTSAHMEPALTTVYQPFYEMGQRAAELLLALVDTPRYINGPNYNGRVLDAHSTLITEPIRIKMPTRLIVRASCGASRGVMTV